MDPEVTRYIEENRDRYTREAIEAHLLEAGYTEAVIAASWPAVRQERPPVRGDRAFWLPFIGSVAGMYGVTFLVYTLSFDRFFEPIASFLLLIFLLLAAVISVSIVRARRSWGAFSGLLTALVIPFVFLIIVAGLCSSLTGAPFAR